MNPTSIRQWLKDVLEGLPGVHVYDVDPDSPNVPAVIISPDGTQYIDYQGAFAKGLVEVRFNLELLVSTAAVAAAQQTLDAMLSAGTDGDELSVFNILDSNRTALQTEFKGDLIVSKVTGVGLRSGGDDTIRWLGADMQVAVYTPRT